MPSGDVETLWDLLDDRLAFTAPGGTALNEQANLSAHASKLLRLDGLALVAADDHRADGLVVTTTRADLAGTYAGEVVGGTFVYTRVGSRSSGRWRVIAGHASATRPTVTASAR